MRGLHHARLLTVFVWVAILATRLEGNNVLSDGLFRLKMREYLPQAYTHFRSMYADKGQMRLCLYPRLMEAMRSADDPDLPRPPRHLPPKQLIGLHEKQRAQMVKSFAREEKDGVAGRTDMFKTVSTHSSGLEHLGGPTRSGVLLQDLGSSLEAAGYTHVALADLQPDAVNSGRFVIVRQVARPLKQVGASLLVEDLRGSIEQCSVYNVLCPFSGSLPDATLAFPLNTVFLVLDPCFKASAFRTSFLLRVDNPTLLVRLNGIEHDKLPRLGDEALADKLKGWLAPLQAPHANKGAASAAGAAASSPSPSEAREAGNAFFQKGWFQRAAIEYTLGIEGVCARGGLHASPSAADVASAALLYSNRAQALLRMGEDLLAARDGEAAVRLLSAASITPKVLGEHPSLAKAVYRWALALWNLQAYGGALAAMNENQHILDACFPRGVSADSEPTLQGIALLRERLRNVTEARGASGYDFGEILREHRAAQARGDLARFSLPNYVHPSVCVGTAKDKGGTRGLFATLDIEPGTLVAVAKAVGLSQGRSSGAGAVPTFEYSFRGAKDKDKGVRLEKASQLMCKWKVLQSVLARGRGWHIAQWLCADSSAIDLRSETLEGGDEGRGPWVDVGALYEKIRMSQFGVDASIPGEGDEEEEAGKDPGAGLFGVVSLLNHACAPLCKLLTLGDMQFVVAHVPIRAGNELTISYSPAMDTYQFSEEDLGAEVGSNWGFKCACILCAARNSNPDAFQQAKELLEEVEKIRYKLRAGKAQDASILGKITADSLLDRMRRLGCAICVGGDNPYLSVMLYHQAEIALARKDYAEAASLCEQSLAASPVDSPVSWIFHPSLPSRYERMACYSLLKQAGGAKQANVFADKARDLALREAAGSYEIAKALYPQDSVLRIKNASGKVTQLPSFWEGF